MKTYNNEKCIIACTSWTKRINYLHRTIKSLINQGSEYHIVITLSIPEFPNKENDLPKELLELQDHFEIIWVNENYKQFKKFLFTMDKYKILPIITVDDDTEYLQGFAEKLYTEWCNDKEYNIGFEGGYLSGEMPILYGWGVIYPPYYFNNVGLNLLLDEFYNNNYNDDVYYAYLRKLLNLTKIKILYKQKDKYIYQFTNKYSSSNYISIDYKQNNSFYENIIKNRTI